MVLYLTSSFVQYNEKGYNENSEPIDFCGFFDDIQREWPDEARILYVPCDPDNKEENECQKDMVLDLISRTRLGINGIKVLDEAASVAELVAWSNIIYLAGGHAPTQLAFMKRIGLKDALVGYDGMVVAVGAGSINAAFYVYHLPELAGEAKNPNYVRFSDGLDLTNIQIIPHRDYIRGRTIDGLEIISDLVIPTALAVDFISYRTEAISRLKMERQSLEVKVK